MLKLRLFLALGPDQLGFNIFYDQHGLLSNKPKHDGPTDSTFWIEMATQRVLLVASK